MAAQLTRVQTPSSNNGAAAAATVVLTFASTGAGNVLFACIIAGTSTSITPPAGWVQIGTTQNLTSGGIMACYIYPNNPGAITTQTFNLSPSGLAVALGAEYSGTIIGAGVDAFNFGVFSPGTGFTTSNVNLQEYNDALIGIVGYINTAALGYSNIPVAFTQRATAITTAGAANANGALYTADYAQAASSLFSGTLSGSPTAGPTCVIIGLQVTPVYPNNGNVGPIIQGTGVLI